MGFKDTNSDFRRQEYAKTPDYRSLRKERKKKKIGKNECLELRLKKYMGYWVCRGCSGVNYNTRDDVNVCHVTELRELGHVRVFLAGLLQAKLPERKLEGGRYGSRQDLDLST